MQKVVRRAALHKAALLSFMTGCIWGAVLSVLFSGMLRITEPPAGNGLSFAKDKAVSDCNRRYRLSGRADSALRFSGSVHRMNGTNLFTELLKQAKLCITAMEITRHSQGRRNLRT